MDERDLQAVMDTNFGGVFNCTRAVAKTMIQQKTGRIINISSIVAERAAKGLSNYAASKGAVNAFTRAMAFELGSKGITVNAVGPVPIATDLTRSIPQEKLDALVARQAIPKMGEPADVANVVDFFLRPESSMVTGQVVYLGGP